MEVEAKFGMPDERTFRRLLKAIALAGFSLDEPRVADPHDRCLDTADGAFRAGGYACRIRRQDSQTLATLKGLGAVSAAIHHRTEHQVERPETLSPRDWPQSAARDLALHLGSGEPLFLLFEIHQTRHRRLLCDGYRSVASSTWTVFARTGATTWLPPFWNWRSNSCRMAASRTWLDWPSSFRKAKKDKSKNKGRKIKLRIKIIKEKKE